MPGTPRTGRSGLRRLLWPTGQYKMRWKKKNAVPEAPHLSAANLELIGLHPIHLLKIRIDFNAIEWHELLQTSFWYVCTYLTSDHNYVTNS